MLPVAILSCGIIGGWKFIAIEGLPIDASMYTMEQFICLPHTHTHTQVMATTFSLIIIWVLIAVGLGGVLSFYLQWFLTCPSAPDPNACITYVDAGELSFNVLTIEIQN